MKAILQTGPGFFAANTIGDKKTGSMRFHCARIETYECPIQDAAMDQVQFELLVAKVEDEPGLAKILLTLADSINGNRALLEEKAEKDSR